MFQLLATPPSNAEAYRYDSVASGEMRSAIADLPLPVLEDLSEALLDFNSLADLQAWLDRQ